MNDTCGYIYDVVTLCKVLDFPEEVCTRLEQLAQKMPWQMLTPFMKKLEAPDTAPEAMRQVEQLTQALDADGFGPLTVLVAAACQTRVRYRAAGIPDSIFIDTMRCFSRMVREVQANTGRWGFDRGFWVWRQVSGCLFRIGTLEFEYCGAHKAVPLADGRLPERTPVLYVHIPSDASLSSASLEESYQAAGRFFVSYQKTVCARMGMPRAVLCSSWLLAPALTQLLAPSSGIRRFAADYSIFAANPKDEEFYHWLFGKKMPLDQLPQTTSLQRAVKKHLLEGKTIGDGSGILQRKLF